MKLLVQRWVQNPYYQVITGEVEFQFQWMLPCDPMNLTKSRNRSRKGEQQYFPESGYDC